MEKPVAVGAINTPYICIRISLLNPKKINMIVTISKTPTETRKNSFFSNFKGSKRVLWASYRSYR